MTSQDQVWPSGEQWRCWAAPCRFQYPQILVFARGPGTDPCGQRRPTVLADVDCKERLASQKERSKWVLQLIDG